MNATTNSVERDAADKRTMDQGFDSFMRHPATRLLISVIPRNEQHPEVVETLLRGAYETGFQTGQGCGIMSSVIAMMEAKKNETTIKP